MDGVTEPLPSSSICGRIAPRSEEPVCLPRVSLRCNKTALIPSNDKADAPVPDAIIKSVLINQKACVTGDVCVMTGEIVMRG